jgi:phosphoserine phosphatase
MGPEARGRSYLEEHAQYRSSALPAPPPVNGHATIDSIVEAAIPNTNGTGKETAPRVVPLPVAPIHGVPLGGNGGRKHVVAEAGTSHALSHAGCQAAPESAEDGDGEQRKIVATIFYKGREVRHTASPDSRSPSPNGEVPILGKEVPKPAPVSSGDANPLEPEPADESEPLSHLYGSFVSPLCITSFLALLSSLPLPRGYTHISSSHKCLDVPAPGQPRVVELTFSPAPDPRYLSLEDLRKHELVYRFEREWNVDVVLQYDAPERRYPRLVVFDMDSTLIEQEVIDLIAASLGPAVEAEVSNITERAMRGELDFEASLRARAKLLNGVDGDIFEKLKEVLRVTNGVPETIRALKRMGTRTAVLSGGFIPLTSWLAKRLGIDYAFANTLIVSSETEKLTGELEGIIVDSTQKAKYLLEIAERENVDLSQVLAVGDGANDLKMMKEASLGVAWNAKPRVQMEADACLNGSSMTDLLFLMGLTRDEITALSRQ